MNGSRDYDFLSNQSTVLVQHQPRAVLQLQQELDAIFKELSETSMSPMLRSKCEQIAADSPISSDQTLSLECLKEATIRVSGHAKIFTLTACDECDSRCTHHIFNFFMVLLAVTILSCLVSGG